MCTLCLSDMGELNDEWMRAPKKLMAPYVFTTVASTERLPLPASESIAGFHAMPPAAQTAATRPGIPA